jgi:hypothetical protein
MANRYILAVCFIALVTILVASVVITYIPTKAFAQYTFPNKPVLKPEEVNTYGPLINSVIYQVQSDQAAFESVTTHQVQAMEWTLTPTQYATALTVPNVYANYTANYAFDGIAFNMLQAPYNNTHFRRAIAYLTNYAQLQQVWGLYGMATPDPFPATLYPTFANPAIIYPYKYNVTAAIKELLQVPGMSYDAHTGTWTYNGKPFSPQLLYRSDDPVRTYGAVALFQTAKLINLTITLVPITSRAANSLVYGPSAAAVISPGVMASNFSTVTPPVFNYTFAATEDTWGMYTFGWIVSSLPTWSFFFWSSTQVSVANFVNFFNLTMDYWTALLVYGAANQQVAYNAISHIKKTFYDNLPYIIWIWTNQLYAVNTLGWDGYANLPATGPSTSTGLYYTLLNVHPVNATGGTFIEVLHQAPTQLNPLYLINWVWQVDVWQEIYDSPLATPPTGVLNASLIPWMASYSVQNNVTVPIGNSSGWWNPFGAKQIVHGQIITLDFYKNITWADGVPLNAYDYNFSLWYWNIQALTAALTPLAGTFTPPFGLIATYIPPDNPYEIKMYVNSTSIYNIYAAIVPVLPMHIFKYFDPAKVASYPSVMDTTLPLASFNYSRFLASPTTKLPTFLFWLPNLEVGSGPFVFQSWDKVSNVINLTRNVNYFRSAWWAFTSNVHKGDTYSFSVTITQEIYNPTSSPFMGVAAGQKGYIPINNATGKVFVVDQNGNVVASYTLSSSGNGVYTAQINTSNLSPGLYKLMVNATYTLFGLPRVWLSYSGLNVLPPVTYTVSITVTTTSGQPLANATVKLGNMTAVTNAQGVAEFANVTPGTYMVQIIYQGKTIANQTVGVSAGSTSFSVTATPPSPPPPPPSPPSGPNYTLYVIIAVVIIIIIIAGVVAYLRTRRPKVPAT